MGLNNDSSKMPEWLQKRKPVKDFRTGDVIEDTEPVGWPDDQYGHPQGGGFRVVNYFILTLVEKCGGTNGTRWTFWAVDTATHKVEQVRFTDLRWYPVTR